MIKCLEHKRGKDECEFELWMTAVDSDKLLRGVLWNETKWTAANALPALLSLLLRYAIWYIAVRSQENIRMLKTQYEIMSGANFNLSFYFFEQNIILQHITRSILFLWLFGRWMIEWFECYARKILFIQKWNKKYSTFL